jgi:glyceraldehyde-3-phosphate dehydrogenase (NADP+)
MQGTDAAVELVNRSTYGLQGCVFTSNIDSALSIAHKMDTGTVQINGAPARGPDHFPFQGTKDSGMGSQGIENSIRFMAKTKTIVINSTV